MKESSKTPKEHHLLGFQSVSLDKWHLCNTIYSYYIGACHNYVENIFKEATKPTLYSVILLAWIIYKKGYSALRKIGPDLVEVSRN